MLTAEKIRRLFDYYPSTGHLVWRNRPRSDFKAERSFKTFNTLRVGRVAGNIDCLDGYCKIGIDRKLYRAHRLVWLHVHGSWPDGEIDHINQDKGDNRIENLRSVDRRTNARNVPIRKDNTSGHVGIRPRGNSFRAFIGNSLLGTFATLEEALDARKSAEKEHGYYGDRPSGRFVSTLEAG